MMALIMPSMSRVLLSMGNKVTFTPKGLPGASVAIFLISSRRPWHHVDGQATAKKHDAKYSSHLHPAPFVVDGDRRDDAEATGVTDGGGHLGVADMVHPALDDGHFDAEHLSELGLNRHACGEEGGRGKFLRGGRGWRRYGRVASGRWRGGKRW